MKHPAAGAILLSLLPAAELLAQAPQGAEFRVNTYTSRAQYYPSLAADDAGNFVVVWESQGQDGAHRGVFAQRFDAAAQRLGAEFRVNTYTLDRQWQPSVGSDAAGNFVVAWASYVQDGSGDGVFAQRFDSSGAPRGGEFRVNAYTPRSQIAPQVAVGPAGEFVIVWASDRQDGDYWGVFGRRFDSSGQPIGLDFQVNTTTTGIQRTPSLAMDAAGDFVVAWTSFFGPGDGNLDGVFAQRFDASGARRGSEFLVNTYTTGKQMAPSVASDEAGNFVIAWMSLNQDGSGYGIFAQRFDASGAQRGSEFQVNTFTTSWQTQPAVAGDADGAFVVTWGHGLYPIPRQIFARRYDANGAAAGPEFPVSTNTNAEKPAVLMAAGGFLAVWQRDFDGDYWGVFGQRFGGLSAAGLVVDPGASSGSNGNRVLEPGETAVAVQPSWTNRSGETQMLDGIATSFTGPSAPGVSYDLPDGAAAYGVVPDGATASCIDCYEIGVAFGGTRPAAHWDATLLERLTTGSFATNKAWTVHVGQSFVDVPFTSFYYRDVETLLHKGITAGCSTASYCPASVTTREQMAAFVLLAREGAAYRPAACAPPNFFADVPATSPFCDVIEELVLRGVVSGCGGGNYCPTAAVLREQMAVFVLRTLDPAMSPPPCTTPLFGDVPANSPFCRWIEELARRGVVNGCGGGNYCPQAAVTRDQMAVFLTGTFGLTLYGP